MVDGERVDPVLDQLDRPVDEYAWCSRAGGWASDFSRRQTTATKQRPPRPRGRARVQAATLAGIPTAARRSARELVARAPPPARNAARSVRRPKLLNLSWSVFSHRLVRPSRAWRAEAWRTGKVARVGTSSAEPQRPGERVGGSSIRSQSGCRRTPRTWAKLPRQARIRQHRCRFAAYG
jgi:hypothetical protein